MAWWFVCPQTGLQSSLLHRLWRWSPRSGSRCGSSYSKMSSERRKKNCIWVKGGNMAQHIYTSNKVVRLVAHFPMPQINPPSNTFFVKVLVACAPTHIQHNTLTPSQVLPLPLLQTHYGTTLHSIHPLTSDATALVTTSCILFYFFSPFLLLKSSSRAITTPTIIA